jgi:tellurite resistance protein TehA-like permease
VTTVVARLATGYALDRHPGPLVGAIFLGLPLLGIPLLLLVARSPAIFIGIALCGVAVAAEVDLIGYYISRYFGLPAFSTIYGFIFPVPPVGVGVGTAPVAVPGRA